MDLLDVEAMSEAQKVDPETLNLARSDDHFLDLKYVTIPGTEKQLMVDTSQGRFGPLVPQALQKKCLKHFIFCCVLFGIRISAQQQFLKCALNADLIKTCDLEIIMPF